MPTTRTRRLAAATIVLLVVNAAAAVAVTRDSAQHATSSNVHTVTPPPTRPAASTPVPIQPTHVGAPLAVPADRAQDTTTPEVASPPEPVAAPEPDGWGCDAALAYLRQHAHPAFELQCPGAVFPPGAQAMTCQDVAGVCPGRQVIAIRVPCPVAYMNEAANSWVAAARQPGQDVSAQFDPYGSTC